MSKPKKPCGANSNIPPGKAGKKQTMHNTITIYLEDSPHEITAGTTLAQLLTDLGHAESDVSTAINGNFIPREERSCVLKSEDMVLCFQAIAGG